MVHTSTQWALILTSMDGNTATEPLPPPCWVCSQIAIHAAEFLSSELPSWPPNKITDRASLQDSAKSCMTCQKLLECLMQRAGPIIKPFSHDHTESLLAWSNSQRNVPILALYFKHSTAVVALLPEKTRIDQKSYHVVIDPHQINLQQIQTWIEICDTQHGNGCRTANDTDTLPLPPTMLLIDVQDMCLRQMHGKVSYVCLSYVWGSEQKPFQALKHNLDYLKRPGALTAPRVRLPATVRDAISLTAKLSLRYLWIDRLCILQDDAGHKSTQIGHMAGIYNNASFTICATDGDDADHGLCGIGQGSRPRNYVQAVFRFGPSPTFAVCEKDFYEDETTKWYTRGWTYQERLLSNRRLIFNGQLIKWTCRKAFWSETANPGPHMTFDDEFAPPARIPRHPRPEDYFRLAESFKKRTLGDENDGLNAFVGILSSLNKSFPGGFHFGLPQCMFDHALLWYTVVQEDCDIDWWAAQRRKSFPSWTWVGWHSRISYDMGKFLYTPYIRYRHHLRSMVKWQRRTREGQCVDIEVLYDYWRSYYQNTDKKPPPGWIRVIENVENNTTTSGTSNGGVDRRERLKRIHYVHESFKPEDLGYRPDNLLYHPVPTPQAKSVSDERDWSPFLHGKLQTNVFPLVMAAKAKGSDFPLDILGSDGEIIGGIHPNIDFKSRCAQAKPEAFIGISKVVMQVEGKNHELEERNNIHVLWIQWQDGIAYRLGVGRIKEEAWCNASLAEFDIQLG